jgi:PIN domain nuclease of toxin-antitoxin system
MILPASKSYLADSNAFLWLLEEDRRLNREAARLFEDADTSISISAASIWELEIKCTAGKLRLDFDLQERAAFFGFPLLDITSDDAVTAARLPLIHRDPFDRMMIAQAQLRRLTVITADPVMLRYGVPVVWAGA